MAIINWFWLYAPIIICTMVIERTIYSCGKSNSQLYSIYPFYVRNRVDTLIITITSSNDMMMILLMYHFIII